MTLFESLFVAHLAGDWLLQTDWQARNKERNWVALLGHVAVYHLLILAVLWLRLGIGNVRVYTVVFVLAVTHALMDRRWPFVGFLRAVRVIGPDPPQPWVLVLMDQAIHILLIGLAVLYLSS